MRSEIWRTSRLSLWKKRCRPAAATAAGDGAYGCRLELRASLEAVAGQPTDLVHNWPPIGGQHEASGNPEPLPRGAGRGLLGDSTQVQKDDGSWMEVQSPLSVLVTLPDEERSIDQAMDLILEQVNRAAKEKVVWGFYPF
ncbi:MAG: hypothetical protein U0002_04055 [Thermoanaerobaculia bacterium]